MMRVIFAAFDAFCSCGVVEQGMVHLMQSIKIMFGELHRLMRRLSEISRPTALNLAVD
jgi:hypothetical protein